jgi:uncharacterized protein involved in exopolysaccharide biosynthesis
MSSNQIPRYELAFKNAASKILAAKQRILLILLTGAVAGLSTSYIVPKKYGSTSAIIVTSGDALDIGSLKGLASQIGISSSIPKGSEWTPEIVAGLLMSENLLRKISADTFRLESQPSKVVPLTTILDSNFAFVPAKKTDTLANYRAVEWLKKNLRVDSERRSGKITLRIETPDPSLGVQIIKRHIQNADEYLFNVTRDRASTEKKQLEVRLQSQAERLRLAEAKLASFERANRKFDQSPELKFELQRLEREVALQGQVQLQVAQSKEQAIARELRMAPTITQLEPPLKPYRSSSTRRAVWIICGILISFAMVLGQVLIQEMRQVSNTELNSPVT